LPRAIRLGRYGHPSGQRVTPCRRSRPSSGLQGGPRHADGLTRQIGTAGDFGAASRRHQKSGGNRMKPDYQLRAQRQKRIRQLLAKGYRRKAIFEELGISESSYQRAVTYQDRRGESAKRALKDVIEQLRAEGAPEHVIFANFGRV